MLLTYEYDYRSVFKEFPMSKTMLFSDVDSVCEINGIQAVYKYQKVEGVLRCILDFCAVYCNEISVATSTVCEHSKLIGIYSPVKRCGKTAFAMEYARHLAESEKVLFITLEEYAPILHENAWKYDLEDLIYFYLGCQMLNIITTMNGRSLQWILHLRCCNKAQWQIRAIFQNIVPQVKEVAPLLGQKLGATCDTERKCYEGKECCGKIDALLEMDKERK